MPARRQACHDLRNSGAAGHVWLCMTLVRAAAPLLLWTLLSLPAAPAGAAELTLREGRYHSAARWDYLPDSRWLAADWRALLPDLESQALASLSYQESPLSGAFSQAVVGLRGQPAGQLSLIYYSPYGYAYLVRRALPLPRSGQLFAGLELPAGESGGLTRVLLWSQQPDPEALQRMLSQPLALSPPVPGVIGQQWLARQPLSAAEWPWLAIYNNHPLPPRGFDARAWPYCFARVDDAGLPVLKDCVVNSTGRTVSDPQDYRNYAWELHWGDELVLSFSLPQSYELRRGELRLDVVQSADSAPGSGLGQDELVVEINGWDTSQLGGLYSAGDALEPRSLGVSHYLRTGVNQIRLRAPALAGQSLLVRRIELWID